MHFWIDKRSQTCGFGRARVAASLSGGGGVGLGFGHPPRRLGGKSVVTPIHRLQSNDCNRMHSIHNTNNNNSNNNVSSNNNNNNSNNNSNSNNNNGSNNRANRNRNSNTNTQYHEANNHSPAGPMGRHHNSLDNVYLQRSNLPPVNVECHIPIPLPHIYGGPSHAQELEQGSLGIGPITIRPNMSGIGNTSGNVNVAVETGESQLLPSHLKCGMWASLVLASVFVAGAKFYFDHQGTGLEVLIFCAFSATFFLAACTVSICRLPRDLAASPSASIDGQTRGLDGQLHDIGHQNQAHLFSQSPDQDSIINQQSAATAAPPPPYHIAILLPENSKDLQPDETPPPSYDKILI